MNFVNFYHLYNIINACILSYCRMHTNVNDIHLYFSCAPLDWESASCDINRDLQSLVEFALARRTVVNLTKSQVIVIGSPLLCDALISEIKLNNTSLPSVESVMNLGVILDNGFRYPQYIKISLDTSILI